MISMCGKAEHGLKRRACPGGAAGGANVRLPDDDGIAFVAEKSPARGGASKT